MTRHIGAKTLARFRQGDLSPRRSSRIRAHLAGCERCHALDEDLAGVTTMLADAQPPPIPEHLTARIQTALATEAARRAALTTGPRQHGRPGRAPRRPRLPGFSSPIALRTVAAAAAAVVLAGGGYEVAQHVGGSPSPSRAASGTTHPQPNAGPETGVGSAGVSTGPQLHYTYAGHQGTVTAIISNTNFTPTKLTTQVRNALARHGPASQAAASPSLNSPYAAPAKRAAASEATLQGCVSRIAAGQQVLLVEVARYQGAPARVIVTGAPAGPEQVWVVGVGCSGTSPDVLTRVPLATGG